MNTIPTKTARRKMAKAELLDWATGLCLLEHLDTAEAEALTKAELLNEIDGALLRIEISEEHRAAALDTTSRSAEELLGLAEAPAAEEAPAKPAPKTNYFDTKPGRNAVLTTSCPICEQAAGLRCLGRKGTETTDTHPARMTLWEQRGSEIAARRTRQTAAAS